MDQVKVDEIWLLRLDSDVALILGQIRYAIEQLSFTSNADFITRRGRVTLALDKLRAAEDTLKRAIAPF